MNQKDLCLIVGFTIGALFVAAFGVSKIEAQSKTLWFSYSNGDVTCKGYKIANTVPQINLQCSDSGGTISAGYTASSQPQDVITFGMNTLNPPSSVLCMVGLNGTAMPLSMGSLGTVAANGAAAQCGAQTPITGETWP